MLTTLDLENFDEWLAATTQVVDVLIPKRIQKELRKFDPESMYSDEISFLVECLQKHGERTGDEDMLENLSRDFEKAFLCRYSHIRAYHGCRAFGNLESYEKNGIRRLSRDLLRELAHTVFSGHASQAKIDAAVDKMNIPLYEQSVFLFPDTLSPLDTSSSHYLRSGSEKLHELACDLGLGGRGILASQGVAYLIECEVPLRHVKIGHRYCLWKDLVTKHFRIKAGSKSPPKVFEGAIQLNESVSPSAIRSFRRIDGPIESVAPWH